jgi:hypothetical protein
MLLCGLLLRIWTAQYVHLHRQHSFWAYGQWLAADGLYHMLFLLLCSAGMLLMGTAAGKVAGHWPRSRPKSPPWAA